MAPDGRESMGGIIHPFERNLNSALIAQ